jgi:hypothetical protein
MGTCNLAIGQRSASIWAMALASSVKIGLARSHNSYDSDSTPDFWLSQVYSYPLNPVLP